MIKKHWAILTYCVDQKDKYTGLDHLWTTKKNNTQGWITSAANKESPI